MVEHMQQSNSNYFEADRRVTQSAAAGRKLTSKSIRTHGDYEPEQAWGSQHQLRQHIRFGGTLEDY